MIDRIQELIRFGKYTEAKTMLKGFATKTLEDRRIQHHLLGRIFLNQGELGHAELELSKAINLGENIHLLMDMASLRYMKGQIYEWRLLCAEIESVLKLHSGEIKKLNLYQAKIYLGKFYEEDGWVYKAHDLYQEALNTDLNAVALVNLTRVKALYGLKKDQLAGCYQQLLSLSVGPISKVLKAEAEHSLMLAEMHLVGQEHAWYRVKCALSGVGELDRPDQRLLFYDFIFESLVLGRTLPSEALGMRPLEGLDTFERNVAAVAFSGKSLFSVEEIQSWVAELSWTSHLRLLCLALSRELRPHWQKELRQKIDFFMSTVDKRSQKVWFGILEHLFEQSKPVLSFEIKQKTIRFRGQSVDLSKRKALSALLDLLAESPSVEIDEALKRLWNLPFSPESFHRLRMTAHRLNEILKGLTGQEKMIEVMADAVSWRESIPLKMIR